MVEQPFKAATPIFGLSSRQFVLVIFCSAVFPMKHFIILQIFFTLERCLRRRREEFQLMPTPRPLISPSIVWNLRIVVASGVTDFINTNKCF